MTSVIQICLSLLYFVYICKSFNYRIGSKCGFPGLPHETKIEPEKLIYEDGEEISYRCSGDKIYLKTQTKKCVAGVWMGQRSTCGYFIRNQLMHVMIIDLNTNQTVFEGDTSNFTLSDFQTSFYNEEGTAVTVSKAHIPHKWYFNFSIPLSFDFFILNVRIPQIKLYTSATINPIDAIRVKSVHIINEPQRNCTIDFSTRDESSKIFWFWCTVSANKSFDEPTSISIITSATQPIDMIGLHQVYFTKLHYCGQPQVPLLTKYVSNYEEHDQIQCDPKVAINANEDPILSKFSFENEDPFMSCIDNEYWAGNPKCLPNFFCKIDFRELTEEIISVQNAYIFNETKWFAIEGTVVEYKCKSGFNLVANSRRTCLYNSTWDENGSICSAIKDREMKQNSIFGTQGFMFPVLAILAIILILVIITIIIILKRSRNQNKHEMNKNLKDLRKSENFYDDLISPNDYTEPYYAEQEYAEPEYAQNYEEGNEYELNSSVPTISIKSDVKEETVEVKSPYYLTITKEVDNTQYRSMQKDQYI